MTNGDFFEQMLGAAAAQYTVPNPPPIVPTPKEPGDYCVKCKKPVADLIFQLEDRSRKIFYCNNHKCERFGILTVVIKRVS